MSKMADLQILRVAVPSPLRQSFDYLPPLYSHSDAAPLVPGLRLRVPFGRREVIGILLEVNNSSELDPHKLKAVIEILDKVPILPDKLLQLATWSAEYYQHPLGDSLHTVIPSMLRKGEPLAVRRQCCWQLSTLGKGLPKNALKAAPQQAKLLALLQQGDYLDKDALKEAGISRPILRALIKKGLVDELQIEESPQRGIESPQPDSESHQALKEPALELNPEQQHAFTSISESLEHFRCFLLEGITGSGKTEVYLQIIQRVLEKGRQALLLVPEIGLTPQTVARFRNRFNCAVTVLHSGLSDRQRFEGWLEAQGGSANIIIGTRSATFTPMLRPGIIIIDEEHDLSFKQQDGFRYNARDLAVMRGRYENIPVILGSATPAIESLFNANFKRYQHLKLTKRAGKACHPQFHILDIQRKPLDEGLSEELIAAIKEALDQNHQVLVFLNRRGFAPTMTCHDCGWIAHCSHCEARLTVHREPPHLHCHHCDRQQSIPRQCPDCRSNQLLLLGQGTERSESALQRLFPETRILRVDRDTTQRKAAMHNIVNEVNQGGAMVLVGTQMLAKGHHFPNVTLVAILDADAGLFSTDFRGPERMGQLLIQVAGRAGRANKPGRVYIQTRFPEHPMLNTLVYRGYHPFAQDLLAERQQLRLPPYAYLALIRAEHPDREQVERFLQDTHQNTRQLILDLAKPVSLLGPFPAPLQKRAGRYRYQLLLQAERRQYLQQLLAILCPQLEKAKMGKLRWSIDVDPQDMY